ncbi:hypothetical protein [Kingella sp. (in: b-proteobacteria)]|nr:hypothetical protein [Kingella sp. (in: b-proteobacteria)]MDO4658533.1 hypothetical protein [Kingella sp. (in: b-proteobacteria)]
MEWRRLVAKGLHLARLYWLARCRRAADAPSVAGLANVFQAAY